MNSNDPNACQSLGDRKIVEPAVSADDFVEFFSSYKVPSAKALSLELSFVAMKYVPPTSVQLTLLDQ
jgi:hypothetical protein